MIRAFNEDKPYGRFVREQVAGDVLYPGTRDGVEALGLHRRRPLGLHRPRRGPRDQARRPGRPAPRPRRHGLEHPERLRQPDRPVRPMPRPQVRPGLAGGLLQPPGRLRRPRPGRQALRPRPRRRRAGAPSWRAVGPPWTARDRPALDGRRGPGPASPWPRSTAGSRRLEALESRKAGEVAGLRLPQRPLDGRPRPSSGSRSTWAGRSRSPGSSSTPATTTSTGSAPGSASPPGSGSRRRTTPTSDRPSRHRRPDRARTSPTPGSRRSAFDVAGRRPGTSG